ncbi:helix-turn-helix transcriptional regulator [Cohaesibacter haloalkalitolerans]|uniref:helix-turn-helix transcriptional regulator n=1 Tax=Cohaesibacter haloalkalitolerans TaxID=1162980 RepID=UPI000E65BDB2|nr:AraC family transcriptional regulator [Cohaesibacter haloalkalitolerans]
MRSKDHSVFNFLRDSSSAIRHGSLDLGFGRSCAIWSNSQDHLTYDDLEGHALSFYVRDGQDVWRVDQEPKHGWPGAMCIFPQGQSSEWLVNGPLTMMHLYLPDEELRRCYSEMMDRDGRQIELAEATYVSPDDLIVPFAHLFQATNERNLLGAEEAMVELIAGVLVQKRFHGEVVVPMRGGLSAPVKRRLIDYIEANLDRVIHLRDLGQIANLSEFHLQRSFKQTCGVSPNLYIAHRRVEQAKGLIRAGEPLAQVADACGFSSQSHFTRSFKTGTGATPAAYRKGVA